MRASGQERTLTTRINSSHIMTSAMVWHAGFVVSFSPDRLPGSITESFGARGVSTLTTAWIVATIT